MGIHFQWSVSIIIIQDIEVMNTVIKMKGRNVEEVAKMLKRTGLN